MAVVHFNQKHYQVLSQTVRQVRQMPRSIAPAMHHFQQQRTITAKLNEDLTAATDFANDPATATASVWEKDSTGDMVDTGRDVDVINRFENTETLVTGTIVELEWKHGEWRVYAADCGA